MIAEGMTNARMVLTSTTSPSKLVVAVIIICYSVGAFPTRQRPSILRALVKMINISYSFTGKEKSENSLISANIDSILASLEIQMKESGRKEATQKDLSKDIRKVKKTIIKIIYSFEDSDSFASFITDASDLLVEDVIEGQQKLEQRGNADYKLLTRYSFLGRFLHNICLSFKYAEFETTVMIWRAFDQYRRETQIPNAINILNANKIILAPQFEEVIQDPTPVLAIPQSDLTNLIEHQISLLESYGAPISPEVKNVLELLPKMEPGFLPSGNYIKYLECLKDNDFEGSFENLHRYFDYMISGQARPLYHYALLSLATAYASFGCDEQAMSAIGEAIVVARENKDLACLNYLLTWVYNFAKDRPQLDLLLEKDYSDKQKILSFLKFKTKESVSKQLQSIYYQFKVAEEMNGQGQMQKIFEDLSISSYLSLLYDEKTDEDSTDFSIFAKSCLLASTLWLRLGVLAFAEVYLDIALDSATRQKNLYDTVSVSIKKAYLEFYKDNISTAFEIFDQLEDQVLHNSYLFKVWESRRLALQARFQLKENNIDLASTLLSKLDAHKEVLNDVEFTSEVDALKCMLDEITI